MSPTFFGADFGPKKPDDAEGRCSSQLHCRSFREVLGYIYIVIYIYKERDKGRDMRRERERVCERKSETNRERERETHTETQREREREREKRERERDGNTSAGGQYLVKKISIFPSLWLKLAKETAPNGWVFFRVSKFLLLSSACLLLP